MAGLRDAVAIVTGAGRRGGIGAAVALRLAREGAHVVIGDICSPPADLPHAGSSRWEDCVTLAEEIESFGVRALALRLNVALASSVQEMVARVQEEFGRLDVLVNNAGTAIGPAPVVLMEEDAWRRTLEINATGTFLCCKYALPLMIEVGCGGRIINMSSIAADRPKPYASAYGASKAAIVALTRSLAQEVAVHGITVNSILPGDVHTELKHWALQVEATATGRSYEETLAAAEARVPLGRFATPEDVAQLVSFLASDEAAFITGQAYNLTGGRELT